MSAARFHGVVLPEGETRDLYVVDGHITYEPVPGAETAAHGWIVPGLVDAHCHVGLAAGGGVDEAEQERQILADRDTGALLLRDAGSPVDTRWIDDRDDLPRLIRAGRHIARTRRYLRDFGWEIEPDQIVEYIERQAELGDGWVKLVGDWIDRGVGDLAPSFPAEAFRAAIDAAHAKGARVTAHVFGEETLPMLLDAGIDCIEHGTGLSTALIDQMVDQGTALVPTVLQIGNFPDIAANGREKFPQYADHMTELYRGSRDVIMSAHEAGVAIYAGTDAGGSLAHGLIVDEILGLARMGLAPYAALGAASWRAREWLGHNPTLAEGAPADFVVYPSDPLQDLTVLRTPTAIVLRGRRIA